MGMWKGGIRLRVGASCGGLGNLAPACWVLYPSKFEDLRPAWQVLLIVLLPALLFFRSKTFRTCAAASKLSASSGLHTRPAVPADVTKL